MQLQVLLVLLSNLNWNFTSEVYVDLYCEPLLHELSR